MNLLATLQADNVKRARKLFHVDVYGEIWETISEPHKRWLLRGAFLVDEPEIKPWGGYSLEEKHKIRTCALFIDEFAKHQQLIRKNVVAFQKRINAVDD